VGEVTAISHGWAEVVVKNKFQVGDEIEIIHPSGNYIHKLLEMTNLKGEPVQVASGSPMIVRIPLDEKYQGALITRILDAEPNMVPKSDPVIIG
jgi:putative protease